jgi:hypothetical protein
MTDILQSIIAEALIEAEPRDCCRDGHDWQTEGGRHCPKVDWSPGCSQPVFRWLRRIRLWAARRPRPRELRWLSEVDDGMTMYRDAHFSDDGKYRYRLDRRWNDALPYLAFIMLNPSVASDTDDDPTVRKCAGFSERLGFGGFYVLNLYAYIATDPKELKRAHWPTGGALADRVIRRTLDIVDHSGRVICAWGANAKGLSRPGEILAMVREAGLQPHALAINKDGTPAHPLMLPYTCSPVPFA